MYGSVEKLYETLDKLDTNSLKLLKEQLKEKGITRIPFAKLMVTSEDENELVGKEAAILSKKLATIKTDIPEYENVTLDELRIRFNREKALEKFRELEFKSLMDKI